MAQLSASYETIIVLCTKSGDEAISALLEKFKTLIAENGTIDSIDEWGKRRLAYPIEYGTANVETEGYYCLINFTSNPSFPAELERVYKITDGILRTIIIKHDN